MWHGIAWRDAVQCVEWYDASVCNVAESRKGRKGPQIMPRHEMHLYTPVYVRVCELGCVSVCICTCVYMCVCCVYTPCAPFKVVP